MFLQDNQKVELDLENIDEMSQFILVRLLESHEIPFCMRFVGGRVCEDISHLFSTYAIFCGKSWIFYKE